MTCVSQKENIEYTIETTDKKYGDNAKTSRGAMIKANQLMRETKKPVFVTWFRQEDGFCGGLNQSGDHAPTARAWDPSDVPKKRCPKSPSAAVKKNITGKKKTPRKK